MRSTYAVSSDDNANIDQEGSGELRDHVCIVGFGCHLPGGVRSPAELWKFLIEQRSAQGSVPPERFNIQGFHSMDNSLDGTTKAAGGYFIQDDVRSFDNHFFGINNLEATYMDPLQRKLLEVVFECFEDAGYSLEQMSGSNTGVYVGDFTTDYQIMHLRDPDYVHRYSSTGSSKSILANRISHTFNLHGPSMALNTACSSSIYCLHQAVLALEAGDCDAAVVAAANLILSPEQYLETIEAGVLSPSSACHTFDILADGYGRAEGVGALFLKSYSSAVRDHDNIWGIIRATALNANGKTTGISQPSVDLQEAVIRKAYKTAGLELHETDYVECHGTGTAVGDVVEVEALKRCFDTRRGPLLRIGSVKPNLGHSEAASGLTSIMKVLLSFKHEIIPPTYGVNELNPKLAINPRKVQVVVKEQPWPRSLRRASINSFGYGGANGHIILESVESYRQPQLEKRDASLNASRGCFIVPITAKSRHSLERRVAHVSEMIDLTEYEKLKELALTLGTRLSQLNEKAALLISPASTGSAEKTNKFRLSLPKADRLGVTLPLAFVFTGQGSQYPGMAKELFLQNQVFNATICELDHVLQSLPAEYAPNWTLKQTILDVCDEYSISEATRSQALCTAIQIGIVKVLQDWNFHASAVIGHSSGEIAAAFSAGMLNQSQSIMIAYLRGFAVTELCNQGAMLAAGIANDIAEKMIRMNGLQVTVSVACNNSPQSVTLSGSVEGISKLASKLQEQRLFNKMLDTGGKAYHSTIISEAGSFYEELMMKFLPTVCNGESFGHGNNRPKMHFTAGELDEVPTDLLNGPNKAQYWRHNLEKSVQFYPVFKKLVSTKNVHLIEIGPHHGLKGPIQQILAECGPEVQTLPYTPSLVRNQDSNIAMKKLAGVLFLHGNNMNWAKINDMRSGRAAYPKHEIPPYPWDYSAGLLWSESRASIELRNRQHARHPLIGSRHLTDNGIYHTWRNVLNLSELPWLSDHRVEGQIVFPAAGYLCAAMEALSQLNSKTFSAESHQGTNNFLFHEVSINTALVLSEDDMAMGKSVELHTSLLPQKLSPKTYSPHCYEFTISSWCDRHTVVHCVGSIRTTNQTAKYNIAIEKDSCFEVDSSGKWYEKLDNLGLSYGPHFRSLIEVSTDSLRSNTKAMSTVNLFSAANLSYRTKSAASPITLDACLQTALIGASCGTLESLKAQLPVFINSCWVKGTMEETVNGQGTVSTHSSRTSFSTTKAECALHDSNGTSLAQINGLRFAAYTGKVTLTSEVQENHDQPQRNPCLRVRWKPDISRLNARVEQELQVYVKRSACMLSDSALVDPAMATYFVLLELAAHKMPGMQVLEFAESGCQQGQRCLDFLNSNSSFPLCNLWEYGTVAEDGQFVTEGSLSTQFDVLFISEKIASEKFWALGDKIFASFIGSCKVVISHNSGAAQEYFARSSEFDVVSIGSNVLLAVRVFNEPVPIAGKGAVIIYRRPTTYVNTLVSRIRKALYQVIGVSSVSVLAVADIKDLLLDEGTVCISLLEAEDEFLATLTPGDMDCLRCVTNKAHDILWVTTANMLSFGQENPNLTLASGLSRTLMLEQPALRFSVIDIGPAVQPSPILFNQMMQALIPNFDADDKEFICSEGLIHISRFCPDPTLNAMFRRKLRMENHISHAPLGKAGVLRLAIDNIGHMDSIHFEQTRLPCPDIPKGYVEITVKAVSINAKDVYVLGGHAETRGGTTACEFSGVIEAVASDVVDFGPGDRIVVLWPNHFKTTERVPAWAVHKLLPQEDYTTMSTIPVIYTTALYVLHDRANIKAGESILVHAGAGGLGIAVISIAKLAGAVIYATVGSEAKKDFLVTQLGLSAQNIFSSRDTSFGERILEQTGGRGVDIIINSLTGSLLHTSWEICLAEFGRFIEVGKRELLDAGRLNMLGFLRNSTFTAFDLENMLLSEKYEHHQLVANKVQEALRLYRAGAIQLPPLRVFDISDTSQAYRYFSTGGRVGKVVISLERPESVIKVSETKYSTILDPAKVYLLVGCLGGLGRSLSRWMMARGARQFVFLGRSGCAKPEAQRIIAALRGAGAQVEVVTGDVADLDAVHRAILSSKTGGRTIGGVVQAAMGLSEAVFSQMTNDAWHTGVRCKWAGTWNLHDSLKSHAESPGFFLMTSSNSGSVGVATEANYCASNGFLDAFARWRRSHGEAAISIGLGMISEVGYLHENPEIEAILIRRGVQALPETEFLQLIDFGISQDLSFSSGAKMDEDTATGHILSGLESVGFRKLLAQGFDVTNLPLQDPRSQRLAQSLNMEQKMLAATGQVTGHFGHGGSETGLISSIKNETNPDSAYAMILDLIRRHFASLILIPAAQINDSSLLTQFGLDSMLAAEFRTWFWASFTLDIPFLDILGSRNTLQSLAHIVQAHIKGMTNGTT